MLVKMHEPKTGQSGFDIIDAFRKLVQPMGCRDIIILVLRKRKRLAKEKWVGRAIHKGRMQTVGRYVNYHGFCENFLVCFFQGQFFFGWENTFEVLRDDANHEITSFTTARTFHSR